MTAIYLTVTFSDDSEERNYREELEGDNLESILQRFEQALKKMVQKGILLEYNAELVAIESTFQSQFENFTHFFSRVTEIEYGLGYLTEAII